MDLIDYSALENWIPFKLSENGNQCKWLYIGDNFFVDPFFDETVSRCRSLPSNSQLKESVSDFSVLTGLATHLDIIEPSGIIFHISRCGSTLISQLLACQSSNIVLSEVSFFDDLLMSSRNSDQDHDYLKYLEDAINIYGAKRSIEQNNLFIKVDSWHIHFYQELRTLYPDVPFYMMYRDPLEVLVSQKRNRGLQSIPGLIDPSLFGFDDVKDITDLDLYMSMVLESYLKKFVDILSNDLNSFAINYHEGFQRWLKIIEAHSQLKITNDDLLKIEDRGAYHGKFPEKLFNEPKNDVIIPEYLANSMKLFDALKQST